VNNRQACQALERSVRELGVELLLGHRVRGVEVTEDRVLVTGDGWRRSGPWLVVAAGAWSGRIPGLPTLPVRPIKGEMIRLEGIAWPWSGVVRTPYAYAVRRGRSSLLVGATEEAVGFDTDASASGQRALLAMVARLFPSLAGQAPAAHWAGLRPGTPDHLPLVGPLSPPFQRILLATGHYRHGILLAPWTARRIGDLIAGAPPDPIVAAFSPARLRRFPGTPTSNPV
jgi:glycine oxidase